MLVSFNFLVLDSDFLRDFFTSAASWSYWSASSTFSLFFFFSFGAGWASALLSTAFYFFFFWIGGFLAAAAIGTSASAKLSAPPSSLSFDFVPSFFCFSLLFPLAPAIRMAPSLPSRSSDFLLFFLLSSFFWFSFSIFLSFLAYCCYWSSNFLCCFIFFISRFWGSSRSEFENISSFSEIIDSPCLFFFFFCFSILSYCVYRSFLIFSCIWLVSCLFSFAWAVWRLSLSFPWRTLPFRL